MITFALHASYAAVGWISVVVGLHFAGLALVWRQPSYNRLGAAITACGAAGLTAAAVGAPAVAIAVVAGVVPGVLLLAAGLWRIDRFTAARAGSTRPGAGTRASARPDDPDPAAGTSSRAVIVISMSWYPGSGVGGCCRSESGSRRYTDQDTGHTDLGLLRARPVFPPERRIAHVKRFTA